MRVLLLEKHLMSAFVFNSFKTVVWCWSINLIMRKMTLPMNWSVRGVVHTTYAIDCLQSFIELHKSISRMRHWYI